MSNSAPWFRFFTKDFITETLGLNATEVGVYVRLLAAMHEADEPVSGSSLDILPRLLGIRKKVFEASILKLIERGLIERADDGLWSAKLDEECAFRDRKSSKARKNSEKRWRKTQENQWADDANHMHSHTHREPPNGGSQDEDSLEREDYSGPTSADAGRPNVGGEKDSPLDEINLKFAEALEAAALGIEVDPFIHVAAEEPPEYLSALPPCDADELAGWVPEAAGSVQLDDDDGGDADDARRSVRELIELCNARDDDLCTADSLFVARLEGRAVSDLTADEIERLSKIVAALDDSGSDFADDLAAVRPDLSQTRARRTEA